MRRLYLCLLLAACGGGQPVVGMEISECLNPDGDVEPPTEELLLTATEQQVLVVGHRAHPLSCEPDLKVTVDIEEDVRQIIATYDNRSDATNCTCVFDLAYTIEDLADGAWTVSVPGGLQAEAFVQ